MLEPVFWQTFHSNQWCILVYYYYQHFHTHIRTILLIFSIVLLSLRFNWKKVKVFLSTALKPLCQKQKAMLMCNEWGSEQGILDSMPTCVLKRENLERWYRQTYMQSKNRYGDIVNKCMNTKRGRGSGMDWEIGIGMYKVLPLCVKQMTKKNLLYPTGSSTQSSGDLNGRRAKGWGTEGYIWLTSFAVWQKLIQHCTTKKKEKRKREAIRQMPDINDMNERAQSDSLWPHGILQARTLE